MKVATNTGMQSFSGIRKTVHDSYYKIVFVTGETLRCTEDHLFESINGPITARLLTKKDELLHATNNTTFVKSKRHIKKPLVAYDLVDVENGSLYYTNSILSHNCSFLGSSNTLISAAKLQQLVHIEPQVEQKYLNIYEQPRPGHIYITTVDTGAGLSQDYSIVSVIDVTETPYKQVLVYRNNEIDPTSFSIVVESIARKYNMSYLVIESNNDGKIVSKELWDMEYENIINTKSQDGDNIVKTGRRSIPGIMMTKLTKKVGCSKLKDLIETEVLIIRDADTIEELGNFVLSKNSYCAEPGKHDDIVMCLVMFAWFSTTNYFSDVTGKNTTAAIKDNRDDDDIHTLLGFINDGISDDDSSFGFW